MKTAYLDIETDRKCRTTVVGIYIPGEGTKQWVSPYLSRVMMLYLAVKEVEQIITYNGTRFDIPVISRDLGFDISKVFKHRDLLCDLWSHSYYGGLKDTEIQMGIARENKGISGKNAIILWEAYQAGDRSALDTLLSYNNEDIVNLEVIAKRIGVVPN